MDGSSELRTTSWTLTQGFRRLRTFLNATATVRTCPSPCPAKESRLSRIYSSCGPGRATPMGVSRRQSTRTNASVSFVLRSIIILRTGILGWRIPIVNGSRAGLACAKTSNSHRLRVSPRNAISSINTEKLAWKTIGCGQSRTGSKYSTSAGCCTRRRPQKANATGLETRTSSSDFGAIRRYARESEPAEPATQSTWSGVVHPKQARAQYQALREQVPLQEHNASVTYQANKLALNPMPEFPIHALEGNLMSCLCNCCQQPARSTLATSALWKTNYPHSYP